MIGFATAVRARIRSPWLPSVVGVFAVSRIAYALAGVRFDDSALHPATVGQVQWQLLPTRLLSHDLGTSLWNLHSQPPLYNLFCGGLLHLPAGWQRPVAQSVYVSLGLLLAITTFVLMDELGAGKRWAFAVTALVVANPAVVLYENWLSWSYPTAVALTVGAYCLLRWARTRRVRWAAAAVSSFTAVVLIDATFQWPWLLAMTAIVVGMSRRHWRRVLFATAIPVALAATWYAKDAAQVGTSTTSSWLGMNLYQTTLGLAPSSDLRSLTRSGTLDALSEVPAFQPVSRYAPRFTPQPHTGVAATEVASTRLGVPNFNNAVYTRLSGRYLENDLAYIRARPARYASAVALAAEVWSMPADQYEWLAGNYSHISGYAGVYDRAVLLQAQVGANDASVDAELHGTTPPASTISWGVVAVTLFDLLLAPVALLIGKTDRVWLACGAAMWSTVAYSFVVTSLTEVGENMRFRVELGSIPVVLALLTVTVLMARVKHKVPLAGVLQRKIRYRPAVEG